MSSTKPNPEVARISSSDVYESVKSEISEDSLSLRSSPSSVNDPMDVDDALSGGEGTDVVLFANRIPIPRNFEYKTDEYEADQESNVNFDDSATDTSHDEPNVPRNSQSLPRRAPIWVPSRLRDMQLETDEENDAGSEDCGMTSSESFGFTFSPEEEDQEDAETEAMFEANRTDLFVKMMFVSGETAEPSVETTTLIEEITRQQVIEIVSFL